MNKRGTAYFITKRGLDIVFSSLAIFFLLPFYIVIFASIKLDEPKAPVIFKQKRIGRDKEYFDIYKFRTMRMDAPHDVATEDLKDPKMYVTRTGGFLRKFSLDELPQFFNVLKGDMSIVAPRPALWNQYNLIEERDKYKGKYGLTPNQIRPGITGWAQINGRDNNDDAEKAYLDGEYMKRLSIGMDLKCFFGTFMKVFRHEGVKE